MKILSRRKSNATSGCSSYIQEQALHPTPQYNPHLVMHILSIPVPEYSTVGVFTWVFTSVCSFMNSRCSFSCEPSNTCRYCYSSWMFYTLISHPYQYCYPFWQFHPWTLVVCEYCQLLVPSQVLWTTQDLIIDLFSSLTSSLWRIKYNTISNYILHHLRPCVFCELLSTLEQVV